MDKLKREGYNPSLTAVATTYSIVRDEFQPSLIFLYFTVVLSE